jgi:hypothetical protein
MTKTEAKWAERVERWRASGKTAEEFAQPEDFEASTLRYWASRLKHGGAPASEVQDTGVRMMRVKRGRATSTAAPLVVLVGEARVEIRAGFDEAVFRRVVDALGGTR